MDTEQLMDKIDNFHCKYGINKQIKIHTVGTMTHKIKHKKLKRRLCKNGDIIIKNNQKYTISLQQNNDILKIRLIPYQTIIITPLYYKLCNMLKGLI